MSTSFACFLCNVLYGLIQYTYHSRMGIIRKHCQGDLTLCDFANLCGLAKAAIWIFSLLPQLIFNFKRKSVEGLSVLWAAAMFTASFVHSFYVFDRDKYVFFKISLIIVPVMNFSLLCQFWFYSRQPSQLKFTFAAGCLVVYGAIVTLELSVPYDSAPKLEWIAVVFFSIERIPQITLNVMNRSTLGQAIPTIILFAVQETFGYLYYYLLVFEAQFQVMQYFSVTFGYINLIQALWYPGPVNVKVKKNEKVNFGSEYGATVEGDDVFPAEEGQGDDTSQETGQKQAQVTVETEEPQVVLTTYVMPATPGIMDRIRKMSKGNVFLFMCLLFGLTSYVVVLCLKTGTLWALFAPLAVALCQGMVVAYRSYREGTLPCQEPPYPQIQYRSFKS